MITPAPLILEPLTAESFAPFGTAMPHPAEPGRTPPLPAVPNRRAGAKLNVSIIRLPGLHGSLRIAGLERHRHSGQCFVAMGGGRLLVAVAPTRPDGSVDFAAMRVFVTGESFAYHPDIWHAPLAAIGADATVASLLNRDGSAEDAELLALEYPIDVGLG